MGIRTLYVTNVAGVTGTSWWSLLQDGGSAPTAGNTSYGWTVAKTATTSAFWRARLGAVGAATVAASTSTIDSTSGPTVGTGTAITTAGDSFRAGPYTGTFANTNWVFAWNMRAGVAGAIGRLRMRIWKSVNSNGSSASALTGSTQVGSIVTLSTSADTNTAITWAPGGTITLASHYLFFQVEWEETTAGTSNTDNVFFRAGTALITTPVFTYTDPYSLPSVQAWWDPQSGTTLVSGQLTNWVDRVYSNAATGSGATAPTFNTGAGTFNNFPGIQTDNSQNWNMTTSVSVASPFTVITVAKLQFYSSTALTMFCSSATGGVDCVLHPDDGTMGINQDNVAEVTRSSTNVVNQYGVFVFAADASTYLYRCNGTSVGSGSHALGAFASGVIHLCNDPGNAAAFWSGWLGDIISCNVVLATADIQIAEGYLAWKYNLVGYLPGAHPYKAAPPSGVVPFLVPPRERTYKRR